MVTKQVRRIRWRHVSGDYSHFFDDVLVNASKQIDDNLMKKLEPFHLNELTHYKPQFLSGFLAERYSVLLKEGWEKAKQHIAGNINSSVRGLIHADEIRNLYINTRYNNIKYKHILLPMWISAYTYKGKVYRYMVNGQTGEVQGHAPLSPIKIALLVLGIIAVIALVVWFL